MDTRLWGNPGIPTMWKIDLDDSSGVRPESRCARENSNNIADQCRKNGSLRFLIQPSTKTQLFYPSLLALPRYYQLHYIGLWKDRVPRNRLNRTISASSVSIIFTYFHHQNGQFGSIVSISDTHPNQRRTTPWHDTALPQWSFSILHKVLRSRDGHPAQLAKGGRGQTTRGTICKHCTEVPSFTAIFPQWKDKLWHALAYTMCSVSFKLWTNKQK